MVGLNAPGHCRLIVPGADRWQHAQGTYHMFMSAMGGGKTLSSWGTASYIVRAVSKNPAGPFRAVQVRSPDPEISLELGYELSISEGAGDDVVMAASRLHVFIYAGRAPGFPPQPGAGAGGGRHLPAL